MSSCSKVDSNLNNNLIDQQNSSFGKLDQVIYGVMGTFSTLNWRWAVVLISNNVSTDRFERIFTHAKQQMNAKLALKIQYALNTKLLLQAVKKEDTDLFKKLIDLGADINRLEKIYGYTLLHYAVRNDKNEFIRVLLQNGIDIATQDNHSLSKETAFHTAINRENLTAVNIFLDHLEGEGQDLNEAFKRILDGSNLTPLHAAAIKSYKATRVLLERNIDPDIHVSTIENPSISFHTPFYSFKRMFEIMDFFKDLLLGSYKCSYLLNKNFNLAYGEITPLFLAANPLIASELIRQGADVNYTAKREIEGNIEAYPEGYVGGCNDKLTRHEIRIKGEISALDAKLLQISYLLESDSKDAYSLILNQILILKNMVRRGYDLERELDFTIVRDGKDVRIQANLVFFLALIYKHALMYSSFKLSKKDGEKLRKELFELFESIIPNIDINSPMRVSFGQNIFKNIDFSNEVEKIPILVFIAGFYNKIYTPRDRKVRFMLIPLIELLAKHNADYDATDSSGYSLFSFPFMFHHRDRLLKIKETIARSGVITAPSAPYLPDDGSRAEGKM